MIRKLSPLPGLCLLLFVSGLSACEQKPATRTLAVTATAYNSVPSQTDGDPAIAAWGDRLKPGMKAIAVSRDLLKEGLDKGTAVSISGLDGEYLVLDKTGKRFKRRIDIYMGTDVEKARAFGVQELEITWTPE